MTQKIENKIDILFTPGNAGPSDDWHPVQCFESNSRLNQDWCLDSFDDSTYKIGKTKYGDCSTEKLKAPGGKYRYLYHVIRRGIFGEIAGNDFPLNPGDDHVNGPNGVACEHCENSIHMNLAAVLLTTILAIMD